VLLKSSVGLVAAWSGVKRPQQCSPRTFLAVRSFLIPSARSSLLFVGLRRPHGRQAGSTAIKQIGNLRHAEGGVSGLDLTLPRGGENGRFINFSRIASRW